MNEKKMIEAKIWKYAGTCFLILYIDKYPFAIPIKEYEFDLLKMRGLETELKLPYDN
jgi:hypothetical protein